MANKEEKKAMLAGELYRTVLNDRGIDLTDVQSNKFLEDCTFLVSTYPDSTVDTLTHLANDLLDRTLKP